jgi:pimeloyl-ACP methyl ester carboxylesterase
MATYVLIHGAGSDSWYWHLVVPRLEARGHRTIVMDLPVDDDAAGLTTYAQVVLDAIADASAPGGPPDDLVLVAQSMAGLTAPIVSTLVPTRLLVLVAAMVPAPGEAPGAWWENTGHAQAKTASARRDGRDPALDDDPEALFLHDLPDDVRVELLAHGAKAQSGAPFEEPWPLDAWPDVPTRFLLCRDDRFFPADFQRRVVGERLGIVPDEMPGGHLPALAHPDELVEHLERYRTEIPGLE